MTAAAACAHRPATAAKVTSDVATKPKSSASATPSEIVAASPSATPSATRSASTERIPQRQQEAHAERERNVHTHSRADTDPHSHADIHPFAEADAQDRGALRGRRPFSKSCTRAGWARYAIWGWSTGAAAQKVTVVATIGTVAHVAAPRDSVCSQHSGDVSTIGTLPTRQSDELVADVNVGAAAAAGEEITLTAMARALRPLRPRRGHDRHHGRA